MTPIDEIRAERERQISEEGWTPGPWRVEEPDACVIWGECTDDRLGIPIANIRLGYDRNWGRKFKDGERIANAHLIAAAPDLYNALEEAHAALQALTQQAIGGVPQYAIIAMCKASSAIDKARGNPLAEIERLDRAETKREEG